MNAGELAKCLNKPGRKELPVSIILRYKDDDGVPRIHWGEVESVGLGSEELTINGDLEPKKVPEGMSVQDLIDELSLRNRYEKVEIAVIFTENLGLMPLVNYSSMSDEPMIDATEKVLTLVKEDS